MQLLAFQHSISFSKTISPYTEFGGVGFVYEYTPQTLDSGRRHCSGKFVEDQCTWHALMETLQVRQLTVRAPMQC